MEYHKNYRTYGAGSGAKEGLRQKQDFITKQVDRKEKAMIIMASLRDAGLYCTTSFGWVELDRESREQMIKERYRWFRKLYLGELNPAEHELDETEAHDIVEADKQE